MILFENMVCHEDISFADYLKLPGVGHSFLKHAKNGIVEDFAISEKMQIGSIVDGILTDNGGHNYFNHPLYAAALSIAAKIQSDFGTYLRFFKKQVSYHGTAKCTDTGFSLAITGRLDYLLTNIAVIDLKVTDAGAKSNPVKSLLDLIEFMGYDNQLFGYGGMSGVKQYYILIYSKPLRQTFLFKRLTDPAQLRTAELWWSSKIQEHGIYK